MKKTFKLEINAPCDANLEAMQKTTSGFFCDSCAKNVVDLSGKSNYEISKFITETKDRDSICARLKTTQLEEEFSILEPINPISSLKYAVAVAASVLLSSNVAGQEKSTPAVEQVRPSESFALGKIAYQQPTQKTVTFVLKGKLLDVNTRKAIDDKRFSKISVYISGAEQAVDIHPKTGEFSVSLTVPTNTKELSFNFSSNDYYLDKNYKIDLNLIRKNTLNLTFSIDPKDFMMLKIAGGMGVIFQNKTTKTNS
ncbi:hypothetical protein J2X31_000705 [Flavobacterium arsenatis]|uniref:Uncharacterized protein n=1 Tax=Flavobacterium arsenatis TaxID=1484332 RepID=A0ABU1TL51_9FLAO|nr:hypothetical protein [Flavobacterium arsenatis]MDR6966707.1 hypothetical protein [Flavobacterium arsenatis]